MNAVTTFVLMESQEDQGTVSETAVLSLDLFLYAVSYPCAVKKPYFRKLPSPLVEAPFEE